MYYGKIVQNTASFPVLVLSAIKSKIFAADTLQENFLFAFFTNETVARAGPLSAANEIKRA